MTRDILQFSAGKSYNQWWFQSLLGQNSQGALQPALIAIML